MSSPSAHPAPSADLDAALRARLEAAYRARDEAQREIDRLEPLLHSDAAAAHARSAAPAAPLLAVAPPTPPVVLPSVDVSTLGRMDAAQLNALPYGVVTLDARGRVLAYNDTESRMAGLPPERVIGRNFFSDIAPCTRIREFEGRYRDFADRGSPAVLETFDFVFQLASGTQRVLVLITPARYRGQFQVAMIRR